PTNGQPIAKIGAHSGPANAVVVAGALIATAGDDGTVKFWQVPVVVDRPLPPHADAVTALTLSADGTQVLTGGADKIVKQVKLDKGQPIRDYPGATGAIAALSLSAKGDVLAAGTADQRLLLWNTADGKLLSQGIVHQGAVSGVSF